MALSIDAPALTTHDSAEAELQLAQQRKKSAENLSHLTAKALSSPLHHLLNPLKDCLALVCVCVCGGGNDE